MSSSTGRTMQGNDDLKALAAQEVLTVWTAALFASTIAAMPGTGGGVILLWVLVAAMGMYGLYSGAVYRQSQPGRFQLPPGATPRGGPVRVWPCARGGARNEAAGSMCCNTALTRT